MKIYTYWVDRDESGMPEYIKLCMHTWRLAIPGISIEVINHDNLKNYLPETLLTPSFYALSLPMQSDVVSVWVLLSRGGLFMDADTIMTQDIFSSGCFPQDKFSAFGYPLKKSIHLAVMSSPEPNNPVLFQWASHIAERLALPLPLSLPWNYVGNEIIDELLKDGQYENSAYIIDAACCGNILEIDNPHGLPTQRYLDFYFTAPKTNVADIIKKAKCGLISLHNSWTPEAYRKASIETIIQSKDSLLLSHLLINLCNKSGA